MKKIIPLLLLVFLLSAGCTDYRKISVDDVSVSSFRFNSTSSAEITLDILVDNPTRRAVSLEVGDVVLYKEGKDFVLFELDGVPSAPPETKGAVTCLLRARVVDPLAAIAAGLNFRTWHKEDFTLSGKVVVKMEGAGKKTVKLKNIPLDRVIKYFE